MGAPWTHPTRTLPSPLAALTLFVAVVPARAAPPKSELAQQPEIVAFAGHAPALSESSAALGRFTLELVCRTDGTCAVFLLSGQGVVDGPRTTALRGALAELHESGACVGPRSSVSALAGNAGLFIGSPSVGLPIVPLCLVRLDARGEPQVETAERMPALEPLVLGDTPPAVTAFAKGRDYRDFLGPALPAPVVAGLPGGRWVLALVTAPASPNLSQCGERRVFVYDATRRAVDLALTQQLGRALEPALGIVGVACARDLYAVGSTVWLKADTGGRHAEEAAAGIRLGPQGRPPFRVTSADPASVPPPP